MPSKSTKTSKASETTENYLKAVHTLCVESPTGQAAMSRIAAIVGVTTGTATTMIKRLADARLVRYERFAGVALTPRGRTVALDVLRRHRIIETFLVHTLQLDWSVVHAEAERLEHAISPVVLDALDAHLGYPATDPHGDPIPNARGQTRRPSGRPLTHFKLGVRLRIERIADQDADFLSFIASHGLKPGNSAHISAIDLPARSITLTPQRRKPISLGLDAAAKILCRLAPGEK